MSEELESKPIEQEEDEAESKLPNRQSKDMLPVKAVWQVIALGVFYVLLGLTLGWLTIFMFNGEEPLTWISWIFAIFIILGTFSAFYTAWDELRHLNHARSLDAHGMETKARIIDRWTDHYVDGGIYTRKNINHILYTYNDNQNYGKQSMNKGLYKSMANTGWLEIVYLPEKPEVFRLKTSV